MALCKDQLGRSISLRIVFLKPGRFGPGFLARTDRDEIVGAAILGVEAKRHDKRMLEALALIERHHLAIVAMNTICEVVRLITEKLKHRMSGRVDVERMRLSVFGNESGDSRMAAF